MHKDLKIMLTLLIIARPTRDSMGCQRGQILFMHLPDLHWEQRELTQQL